MGYLKRRIIEAMDPKEEPPMEPNTTDTDIVEHLHWLANSAKPMDAAAMRLAAAEIERLRALVPDAKETLREHWDKIHSAPPAP